MYSGYKARRGSSCLFSCTVTRESSSKCGQGASGLTWSRVTGDTPPQSLIPACNNCPRKFGDRLGGAWILAAGPRIRRATAMVQRRSSSEGSGDCAILVPGLLRKFWIMISCKWPCTSFNSRSASSDPIRSRLVSPIPIRIPEVKGICSFPADSMVASRAPGSLSGDP